MGKKLIFKIFLAISLFIVLIGYLIFANMIYLWPFQGTDTITIYVKANTSEESIELLKKDIESLPSIKNVEEIPWPDKELEPNSGAVRLIATFTHSPNDSRVYPLDFTNFLEKGEIDPSHSSNVIISWSSSTKNRNYLDKQVPMGEDVFEGNLEEFL